MPLKGHVTPVQLLSDQPPVTNGVAYRARKDPPIMQTDEGIPCGLVPCYAKLVMTSHPLRPSAALFDTAGHGG